SPRAERQLDDVVDLLEAGAVAEFEAKLEKAARGEPVAGREPDVLVVEPTQGVTHPFAVAWVALEIGPVLLDGATPRRGVDVIDGPTNRRQAAGDERLAQAGRGEREVGHGTEAAETLAENAPPTDAEFLADQLRVADDAVGAQVGHVRGLLLRR